MKVFISWSGKLSGELAKVLRDWLPSVIQAVKPYYSTDDIAKGTRGNTVNAQELEEASLGVLCLTRDNLDAAWIMFEAGALSKKLDKSRVCPILFGGLETTDLKGPLVQFQGAKFTKEDIRRMLTMVNKELGSDALESKVLDSVFEKWWPDLDDKVRSLLSQAPESAPKALRNDRELLEEILTIARSIGAYVPAVARALGPRAGERETTEPKISIDEAKELVSTLRGTGWEDKDIRRILSGLGIPRSIELFVPLRREEVRRDDIPF